MKARRPLIAPVCGVCLAAAEADACRSTGIAGSEKTASARIPVAQETVSATVTSGDNGTAWLPLREGGRYFDIVIAGDWHGRVTLEVRPQGKISATAGGMLEVFVKNTAELYYLDQDSDVRLWVRKDDFIGGEMRLELGT